MKSLSYSCVVDIEKEREVKLLVKTNKQRRVEMCRKLR